MGIILSTDKVTKRFGEITALEEVSFKVADGEFVFFIGPSGAGKITVVKLLLREYLPTSGKIIVDDQTTAYQYCIDARVRGFYRKICRLIYRTPIRVN